LAETNPDKSQTHLADFYLCTLMKVPLLPERLQLIDALQSIDGDLAELVGAVSCDGLHVEVSVYLNQGGTVADVCIAQRLEALAKQHRVSKAA
jgi:hypothetical protein